jgi:hypothetical protein
MERCIYLFSERNFRGARKTIYHLNQDPIDLTDFDTKSLIILRGKWKLYDLPGAQGTQVELRPGFFPDVNRITIGNRSIRRGDLACLCYLEDATGVVTRDPQEIERWNQTVSWEQPGEGLSVTPPVIVYADPTFTGYEQEIYAQTTPTDFNSVISAILVIEGTWELQQTNGTARVRVEPGFYPYIYQDPLSFPNDAPFSIRCLSSVQEPSPLVRTAV